MITTPSPGYSILIRLEIVSKPEVLGKVGSAFGDEDYVIPSVLNRKVPEEVSSNVREAAIQTGVARAEQRVFCVLSGLNHCSFLKKMNSWGVGDENFICRG